MSDSPADPRSAVDALLAELLAETRASRVTLRRDVPDDVFPVTNEALATGVSSLRGERTVDLRTQPVALEARAGRQVVQDDCAAAIADPAFRRMLEAYGGLAAQIVTPVVSGGEVRGILSVHQLGAPRAWAAQEIAAATRAAEQLATMIGGA